jgi:2-desacetyl-2-hydroxyethyl bacteriochlorophyllide A dehydrogenase
VALRIVFPRQGEVALLPFEPRLPGPDEVRVRTLYSLMSIGTETTILHRRYADDSHFARMFSFPQLKTGVQAVGRIERTGGAVTEFATGNLVYVREAHGSHQVLPACECSPVPEAVDPKAACWAGLAKTAFRAAWAAPFRRGGRLLIIGAGPVGQMAVRWSRAAGVAVIAVADLSPFRLQHAARGGATEVYCGTAAEHAKAIARIDDGRGPPIVVDATGNAAVFREALAAAGRFGKVVLLGDTGRPGRQCLSSDLMTKGLTIQATHDSHDRDGWTERRVDRLFFACVRRGRFDLEGLITHEFAPEECATAYALAEASREQTMGILFDWTRQDAADQARNFATATPMNVPIT